MLFSECYSREELLLNIPFADFSSDFRWAVDHNKSFSSELISLGRIGTTEFFEIQQHIDEGYYDYIRFLSIENDEAQLCPFYSIIASDSNIKLTPSYLSNNSMLVDRSRVSGNGGLYVENYFYLENSIVQKIEFKEVLRSATDEVLSENPEYALSSRAGYFSLESMSYSVPIYNNPPECAACSIGTLNFDLEIKNNSVIIVSSEIERYE